MDNTETTRRGLTHMSTEVIHFCIFAQNKKLYRMNVQNVDKICEKCGKYCKPKEEIEKHMYRSHTILLGIYC